jgi:hypothetical protein
MRRIDTYGIHRAVIKASGTAYTILRITYDGFLLLGINADYIDRARIHTVPATNAFLLIYIFNGHSCLLHEPSSGVLSLILTTTLGEQALC